MRKRGPSWEDYEETLNQAETAGQELATARQQVEDLKTLNKQMLTEMQVECNQPEVAVLNAQSLNGLGKYMTPVENTLENNFRLVYDRSNELDFWAEQSPAFDGLVAQTFLDPAFSMSNHPRYFDYEPLRDNISTVRNYALQVVLNGVDARDSAQMKTAERKMEQMGREIGVALQRDSLFKRPGSASLDVSDASEPGVGAAKMYELLKSKQDKSGLFAPIKQVFGYNYSDWGLPEIDRSPFSQANVEAFCIGDFNSPDSRSHLEDIEAAKATQDSRAARREVDDMQTQQPNTTEIPDTPVEGLSNAEQLAILGAGLAGTAKSLNRVENMAEPTKDRSVELAREILDNMRISLVDTSRDQWLEMPAEESLVQNEAIGSIATLYAQSYQAGIANDPSLQDNPTVQQSNLAVGKLAYMMKQQAGMKLVDEGRMDDATAIMSELETYPQSWKQQGEGESVETLLAQMQNGLELTHRAAQKAQKKGFEIDAASAPEAAKLRRDEAININQVNEQHPAQTADDIAQTQAQVQTATARQPLPSQEQLQTILNQGNLSPTELATVRDMQAQAAIMHQEAPSTQLKSHAQSVGCEDKPTSALEKDGTYRTAVQQQPQPEMIKR